MSEFKAGDVVEITGSDGGLDTSKDLIIERVSESGNIIYVSDGKKLISKNKDNVKLLKETEDNMDKEFKIGDKVVITGGTGYHSFQINDIVTIEKEYEYAKSFYCVDSSQKKQIVDIVDLKKIKENNGDKEEKTSFNKYKPNDKVVVIDMNCIGYSLQDILVVNKVLYDDVLEVSDEYGDIGLIKTEYIELYGEKEKFKVGDFVKIIKTDRSYISVGAIGLVSYAYSDGDISLAIVDNDMDFHSDLLFEDGEVEKIEIGEL